MPGLAGFGGLTGGGPAAAATGLQNGKEGLSERKRQASKDNITNDITNVPITVLLPSPHQRLARQGQREQEQEALCQPRVLRQRKANSSKIGEIRWVGWGQVGEVGARGVSEENMETDAKILES